MCRTIKLKRLSTTVTTNIIGRFTDIATHDSAISTSTPQTVRRKPFSFFIRSCPRELS